MVQVDAPSFMASWHAKHKPGLTSVLSFVLILPATASELNKAGVVLETPSHLASLTVWGNGMVEIIYFHKARINEETVLDIEATSTEELEALLDRALADLVPIGGAC